MLVQETGWASMVVTPQWSCSSEEERLVTAPDSICRRGSLGSDTVFACARVHQRLCDNPIINSTWVNQKLFFDRSHCRLFLLDSLQ